MIFAQNALRLSSAKLPRLSKSRRDASASSKADSFGLKVRDFIRAPTEVQPRDPPKEKSLQENSLAMPAGRARDSARAHDAYPLAQGGTRPGAGLNSKLRFTRLSYYNCSRTLRDPLERIASGSSRRQKTHPRIDGALTDAGHGARAKDRLR
jgi:hypothetical protein